MGEWREVRRAMYRQGDCPCNSCAAGWADISQKHEGGKLYEKFDYCQETCEEYRKWLKKEGK